MEHSSASNNHENRQEPEGFSKLNIFKTPETYFDGLSSEIAGRIASGAPSAQPFWQPVRKVAFFGMMAVLLAVGWFFTNPPGRPSQPVTGTPVTYDELVGSGMVYEFDETMLVDVLQAASANGSPTEGSMDDYENYLLNNNTDITLIINEL